MKYKGKKVEGRNSDVLVLMKGGDRIVFKAEAVENYNDFTELVPEPKPPEIIRPGGIKQINLKDFTYVKRMEEYAIQKTNYFIIKSLQISEDIEWEVVDIEKPETWKNWRKELADSNFTEIEILKIMQLCTRVNSLDEDMLDEAKQAFLQEKSPQNE